MSSNAITGALKFLLASFALFAVLFFALSIADHFRDQVRAHADAVEVASR